MKNHNEDNLCKCWLKIENPIVSKHRSYIDSTYNIAFYRQSICIIILVLNSVQMLPVIIIIMGKKRKRNQW